MKNFLQWAFLMVAHIPCGAKIST